MHDNDALNEAARLMVQAVNLTDPDARQRLFDRAAELRAAAKRLEDARNADKPN